MDANGWACLLHKSRFLEIRSFLSSVLLLEFLSLFTFGKAEKIKFPWWGKITGWRVRRMDSSFRDRTRALSSQKIKFAPLMVVDQVKRLSCLLIDNISLFETFSLWIPNKINGKPSSLLLLTENFTEHILFVISYRRHRPEPFIFFSQSSTCLVDSAWPDKGVSSK